MAFTNLSKFLLLGGVITVLVLGANYVLNHGDTGSVAAVPMADGKLVEFKDAAGAPVAAPAGFAAPTSEPATLTSAEVRMDVLAWNAQMGLALATGGSRTTQGSLMARYGVNLNLVRVDDDYSKMKEGLVACATELSRGAEDCTSGYHLVTIMGDGGPYFFAGLNDTLSKLGPDYVAEAVGGFGRSYGEDAFMGPPSCKADPTACKGLLAAGVLMDGDWNIAQYWAKNNDICNNPDVKTWDAECLNWLGTTTFSEADAAYIAGTCEERPVTRNGKKTGERKQVCVGGTVTWTPGDVNVTKTKGGVVKLLSTRENASQMPNLVIGIKKWNATHRDTVVSILRAGLEAGAAIKQDSSGQLLLAAGNASAQIYGAEDGAYWARYYEGTKELDATGKLMVSLGGSRVFDTADARRFFGLEKGAANAFAATYTLFGDIAKQQYPRELPSYPPATAVFNPSYLEAASAATTMPGKVEEVAYSPAAAHVVATRAWHISFQTGSAEIRPESEAVLQELEDTLVVASGASVTITGHTDNTGNPDANLLLSRQRAQSVKSWLVAHAPADFPDVRITVDGKGQTAPVALNATESGRAQNRRVEIVLAN